MILMLISLVVVAAFSQDFSFFLALLLGNQEDKADVEAGRQNRLRFLPDATTIEYWQLARLMEYPTIFYLHPW